MVGEIDLPDVSAAAGARRRGRGLSHLAQHNRTCCLPLSDELAWFGAGTYTAPGQAAYSFRFDVETATANRSKTWAFIWAC